ncbi:MAG TPA: LCP family protein [Limnochordales bacterium]
MAETSAPVTQGAGPFPAGAGRGRLIWVAVGAALVIGFLALWYYWNSRLTAPAAQESVNVLALGVSDEGLDAVTVVSFNPRTDAVAAVALPVDTRVGEAEGAGEPLLLRDVYAEAGLDGLVAAVQNTLNAPIHHTVQVDFAGFVALVDLLGGVPVEVDTDIVYRNAAGETVFRLEPGVHVLDGQEALLYLRYKGDHLSDESRRAQRQWRFLQAMAEQARASLDWSRVQGMLSLAMRHVQTDIDLASATLLAQFVWQSQAEMSLHLLPGRSENGYWVLETAQVQALSDALFYNPSWVAARR